MSLLYSRMYQLIAHSEVSLTALRLTYNALNILEIRFPQQVKRTKSDLKKQIQKMAIGLDDSESMKRNIELVRKAHNEIRKR